jgi:hypothetical protein
VIAVSQGEGDSSDGGSSTHEATPRSELLVSSDGSSYAAPSVGLVPDVWITRARCPLTKSMRVKRAIKRRQAYTGLKPYNVDPIDNAIACVRRLWAIACARCHCVDCDVRRNRNLQKRLKYKASKLYSLDPRKPRLLRSYKGPFDLATA